MCSAMHHQFGKRAAVPFSKRGQSPRFPLLLLIGLRVIAKTETNRAPKCARFFLSSTSNSGPKSLERHFDPVLPFFTPVLHLGLIASFRTGQEFPHRESSAI